MTLSITLTVADIDTGPFNLYSNIDDYTDLFASFIEKSDLLDGYTSTDVPDGTTSIKVQSVNNLCTNFILLTVDATTSTTTSTSSTTSTTTSTTSSTTTTTTTFCANCIPGAEIQIGTQKWSKCNLNVSTYRNGNTIPQVTDPTAWESLTTGAWCYYNNDPTTEAIYGKLYNWHAVNDPRGLAPTGYHVPSNAEWNTLATTLGGFSIAGKKMKEIGQCHWNSDNDANNASNESGFTGLGAGRRLYNGTFQDQLVFGMFWSSNGYTTLDAYFHSLFSGNTSLSTPNATGRGNGFSVRCIKD